MNNILQDSILKSKIKKDKAIVVALSGGVDSMVLFDVIYKLGYNIVIAHVNHNKRPESLNEYLDLEKLAKSLDVPFEGKTLDDLKGNFQENARYERYTFFREVCNKYDTNQMALAHHADDQIETILMRLVRGTSFSGYSGIKQESVFDDKVVHRPFLDIPKEEIVKYAEENCLNFYLDSSNLENKYTRNRFRNNIIPLLKEENPNTISKFQQFSNYMALADDFINEFLQNFTKKHIFDGKVDVNQFNKLHEILKFKVLQHLVNVKTENKIEVQYTQYLDIISLLKNDNPNVRYNLSKGLQLIKEYTYFYVEFPDVSESVFLEINDFGEYSISKEIKYIFSKARLDIKHSNFFELCYNELVFPLYVRNKQNGDKIKLKIGTKKIKDILIDKKVPLKDRDNLILIANNDTVMWIPRIKKSVQNNELENKLYIYEVR